jgi:hypothetical protein
MFEPMGELREATQHEKLLSWPTPQDYNEAVQSPAFCFNDADLKSGVTELNEFGLPRPISGGFASVYHVRQGAREFAVRCFLSRVSNLQYRYEAVTEHLRTHAAPWAVPSSFIAEGMLVGTTWYPILKMEWVKGPTLGSWIEANLSNPQKLHMMRASFQRVAMELQQQGIAHGDLQPANIIVMEDNTLRLVDYDGMYVPALAGARANELGHKNFQHPLRSATDFDGALDNFSAWLISTALEILAVDPSLWHTLNCGDDALLFRHADLVDSDHSYTFSVLEAHENPEIVWRARLIRTLARGPLSAVPSLHCHVEPDTALPPVEYVAPPVVSADIANFQIVPRELHKPRKRRRKSKVGGGAMAMIPAQLAAGFALDSARNRKVVLYPCLVLAALVMVGVVTMRLLSPDMFAYDWIVRQFTPAGVNLFNDAHADWDRGDIYKADIKFTGIIEHFSDPNFGLNRSQLIEAYVHKSQIAHRLGKRPEAKYNLRMAQRLSRETTQTAADQGLQYNDDYFAYQNVVYDIGSIDPELLASRVEQLLAKNPDLARIQPWEMGRLFVLLNEEDTDRAIKFWNAWQGAVTADGYGGDLFYDMVNLAFVEAAGWAESDDKDSQQDGKKLYEMIYKLASTNAVDYSINDQVDALWGMYYVANRDAAKNKKEIARLREAILNAGGRTVYEDDFTLYKTAPPARSYNPDRYHSLDN